MRALPLCARSLPRLLAPTGRECTHTRALVRVAGFSHVPVGLRVASFALVLAATRSHQRTQRHQSITSMFRACTHPRRYKRRPVFVAPPRRESTVDVKKIVQQARKEAHATGGNLAMGMLSRFRQRPPAARWAGSAGVGGSSSAALSPGAAASPDRKDKGFGRRASDHRGRRKSTTGRSPAGKRSNGKKGQKKKDYSARRR